MTDIIDVNSSEELKSIIADNDVVVVKFTAPAWCRPCQQLAPHYKSASEKSDATFVSVDIDNNEWAMVEYGIKGVPTVYLYKDGQYVKNVVGRTVVQILSEIN